MKSSSSTLSAFLLAISAQSAVSTLLTLPADFVPELNKTLITTPVYAKFNDPLVPTIVFDNDVLSARQTIPEPDPNRNVTLQDGLVFVLQCVNAGFREPCIVFGSKPGQCVSYFSYQAANSTAISDIYNDAVSAISTNTGGSCQFYKFLGCDNKGDDRGVTQSYNYDLAVKTEDYSADYDNQITSWRC